jgi:GAF domain-containing protein
LSTHNYEELAALHAIARALAQPWDLRDQLEQVLNEMNACLGMQRGMISLLDRDSGESWLEVAHGVNLAGMEISYQMGEGITGQPRQGSAFPRSHGGAAVIEPGGIVLPLRAHHVRFPGGRHPVSR